MSSLAALGPGPWLALALLGAYHGINPSMGWLLAAARGSGPAGDAGVSGAVVWIAAGHALSVGALVAALAVVLQLVPRETVWLGAAGTLIVFGLRRTVHMRTPGRGYGMRIGPIGLIRWSVRMSWAHGAGLMLIPVLLSISAAQADRALGLSPLTAGLAVAVHTLALLTVMVAMALLCSRSFGTAPLRRWWINMDLLWLTALIGTGLVMLFF